jgi:hypothetical protein
MKIILALALIAAFACAQVVVDRGYGGLRSGRVESALPVRAGVVGGAGLGAWDGFRGAGWNGYRGDAWNGAYDGAWRDGWSVRDEPRAWRDVTGDGIVDWRDDWAVGGARPWTGDWARADWNRDGVIDRADGWRRLDASWAAGAWDPAFSTGWRPEAATVRTVPLNGVVDDWRVRDGPWDTLGWGGAYDGWRGDLGYDGLRGGVRTAAWDGVWDGAWDGARVGAWDGVRTGAWDGARVGAWDGVRAGAWDGARVGAWDGVRAGAWDGEWRGSVAAPVVERAWGGVAAPVVDRAWGGYTAPVVERGWGGLAAPVVDRAWDRTWDRPVVGTGLVDDWAWRDGWRGDWGYDGLRATAPAVSTRAVPAGTTTTSRVVNSAKPAASTASTATTATTAKATTTTKAAGSK